MARTAASSRPRAASLASAFTLLRNFSIFVFREKIVSARISSGSRAISSAKRRAFTIAVCRASSDASLTGSRVIGSTVRNLSIISSWTLIGGRDCICPASFSLFAATTKEEARALVAKTKAQTLVHVRVTGTRASAWKPSARQGASSDLNCCEEPLLIQPKETKIAMPSHAS